MEIDVVPGGQADEARRVGLGFQVWSSLRRPNERYLPSENDKCVPVSEYKIE